MPVRSYPQGDIGSVLLGQVGQITAPSKGVPGELGTSLYKGVTAGSIVGQSGLEAQYQPFLQGIPGEDKIEINASGYPTGAQGKPIEPIPGDQLGTSIHLGLEREGYIALREAMSAARTLHNPATAGAFVAMDPFSGRVYALGSLPTYDANEFATGISTSQYKRDPGRSRRPRPRDRGPLSDRFHVQADHGAGGARERRHHALDARGRRHHLHRRPRRRRPVLQQLGRCQLRQPRPGLRDRGLRGHLLLPAGCGPQRQRPRPGTAGRGPRLRPRALTGDRPPGWRLHRHRPRLPLRRGGQQAGLGTVLRGAGGDARGASEARLRRRHARGHRL